TGELPNCEEDCDVDSPPGETDTPIVQKPGITIDKSADTGDVETVTAGTVITYTFTVKNTGNVTLDDVKITDELPGLVWSESYPNGEIGTMDPGETVVVTATYEVTDADVEA